MRIRIRMNPFPIHAIGRWTDEIERHAWGTVVLHGLFLCAGLDWFVIVGGYQVVLPHRVGMVDALLPTAGDFASFP